MNKLKIMKKAIIQKANKEVNLRRVFNSLEIILNLMIYLLKFLKRVFMTRQEIR